MKKLALLTSILALTACGGSGGGAGTPVWRSDTVITQDMLNKGNGAQSQEIEKKLQTIEYVENNLGAIIENGELTGAVNTSRSATTDRLLAGLLLSDIDARYQQALQYFEILNKVLNADIETSGEITVKDVKIAYSLSSNTKYDEITSDDLPFIDIENEDDETIIYIDSGFRETQLSIKMNCNENEDLKNKASEEVLGDIMAPEKPYAFDISGVTFNISEVGDTGQVVFTTNEAGDIVVADFSLADKFVDDNPNDKKTTFVAYEIKLYVPTEYGHHEFHRTTATPITSIEQLRELMKEDIEYDNSPEEIESVLAYLENMTSLDDENLRIEKVKYETDLTLWGQQIGLKYSEIGDVKLTGTVMTDSGIDTEIEITHMMIAGGDKNRLITKEILSPDNKYEFTGQAHALLTAKDFSIQDDENEFGKYIGATDAKLVFDNGAKTETLTMNFANWYDVEISKDANNQITGKISNDNNKEIESVYKNLDNFIVTEDTFLQAEYYGAGATPEEAIANFGLETWSYTDGANNGGKSMYIEGVFGGVAK